MGRRSKGDRVVTTVKLMLPVWQYCHDAAAARNVPLGTYVADVMAAHADRADLVQEVELFSVSPQSPPCPPVSSSSDTEPRVMTARLMRPVWEFCRVEARRRHTGMWMYVGDVMAVHANRADLVQFTEPKESLPLAL